MGERETGGSRASAAAERAFEEYLSRVRGGEELDFEVFVAQQPGLEDELRPFYRQWKAMRAAGGELPHDVIEGIDSGQRPERIGPYRILDELGEGGMGTVYLGTMSRPIPRKAAIKVVKLGMSTREVLARFESERQTLALMHHSNIAKVLEAGATERGEPYFAMEYIAGLPIHRYCDDRKLGIRERIELFLAVCNGVQHAHQKGVIHRDLKPGNILVAVEDDVPVPKIIDFGLARALGFQSAGQSIHTSRGSFLGTYEYMPPEQATSGPYDIDTRADVYALGVLLYQLLTGQLPFVDLRRAGEQEILRRICEEEPLKPSTRISTTAAESTEAAARRKLDVRALTGRLRGDLDWITMKALEKDRSHRYESATALAEDLRRYLADEPVLACPPGARRRVTKWVRRHRVAAGMAAAAVMPVVGVGMIALGLWIQRSRDQAVRKEALENGLGLVARRDYEGARAALLGLLTPENEPTEEGRTALLAEIGLLYRCGWPVEGRERLREARARLSSLGGVGLANTLPGHAAFAGVLEDGLPPAGDDWIDRLCLKTDPDGHAAAEPLARKLTRSFTLPGLPPPTQGGDPVRLRLGGESVLVYAALEGVGEQKRPFLQLLDLRTRATSKAEFESPDWRGRRIYALHFLETAETSKRPRMIVLSRGEDELARLSDCELDVAAREVHCRSVYPLDPAKLGPLSTMRCWRRSEAVDDLAIIVQYMRGVTFHRLVGEAWSSPTSNLPGLFHEGVPGFLLRGNLTGDGGPELVVSLGEWGEYSLHLLREIPGSDHFAPLSSQRIGASTLGCLVPIGDASGRSDLFFSKHMTWDDYKQSLHFFGRFRSVGIDNAVRLARFDGSTREFRTVAAEPAGLRMKGLFANPLDLAAADLDGDGVVELVQLVATSLPGTNHRDRPDRGEVTLQVLHRSEAGGGTDFEQVLVAGCGAQSMLLEDLGDGDQDPELALVSWPRGENGDSVEISIHGHD